MKKLKGKPVSAGIISGKALVYHSQKEIVLREKISSNQIQRETRRLDNAVKRTAAQLRKISNNLQRVMGKDSALIIETQHILLTEGNLVSDIKEIIHSNLVKAEWAIKKIEKKYFDYFNNIEDLTFREKRNDISDLLNRLTDNLKPSKNSSISQIENAILIADDIPPSMAANLMSKRRLLGLVLNQGGETSHSVILARTLEIPTILNTENATELIANDDHLIVDGLTGEIFIDPDRAFISHYEVKQEKYAHYRERLKSVIHQPDVTRDDHAFSLRANIELPFESDIVNSYGAKGIGLYRTEFLFTDPEIALSEKEQYLVYKSIAQKVFPEPVVIRTFDVGRDKNYGYFNPVEEANPALGTMAVRLFLKEKKLLRTQLRAILRANESGNIKLLLPMICEVEEIHTIARMINEARSDLEHQDDYHGKPVELGIMIEIPGAVELIRHVKNDIDFFSVGTNDLIQYLLAVDRNNSAVSYLFNPFHPAVVDILQRIRREVDAIKKEVTVCGEIAGHGFTALMLLGMGYTQFSMNPISIPEIKRLFTNIHYKTVRRVVSGMSKFASKSEIEEYLVETLLNRYPDLFIKEAVF